MGDGHSEALDRQPCWSGKAFSVVKDGKPLGTRSHWDDKHAAKVCAIMNKVQLWVNDQGAGLSYLVIDYGEGEALKTVGG